MSDVGRHEPAAEAELPPSERNAVTSIGSDGVLLSERAADGPSAVPSIGGDRPLPSGGEAKVATGTGGTAPAAAASEGGALFSKSPLVGGLCGVEGASPTKSSTHARTHARTHACAHARTPALSHARTHASK